MWHFVQFNWIINIFAVYMHLQERKYSQSVEVRLLRDWMGNISISFFQFMAFGEIKKVLLVWNKAKRTSSTRQLVPMIKFGTNSSKYEPYQLLVLKSSINLLMLNRNKKSVREKLSVIAFQERCINTLWLISQFQEQPGERL